MIFYAIENIKFVHLPFNCHSNANPQEIMSYNAVIIYLLFYTYYVNYSTSTYIHIIQF